MKVTARLRARLEELERYQLLLNAIVPNLKYSAFRSVWLKNSSVLK